MTERVVVIGRNYTSRLGMIRAVGMAGYGVTVIKTNGMPGSKDIDAYSKYVNEYLYAKEPNREELISVILSLRSDQGKTIIIPVDDYAASVIDDNINILKEDFLFPNVQMQQGEVVRLMDKHIQKELAEKVGLRIAKGWVVNISNHRYSLPTDIQYPVFPKPQISFKGNKRCMRKCDNEHELKVALDEVASQRDCPILLEQYCEIAKEYALLGFSDGENVYIPAIIQMLLSGSGPHRGVTLQGELSSTSNYTDFVNQLMLFVRSLHFCGLFDVDVYESNGHLYFNELNLRFGASGYAVTHSVINLPLLLIRCLLGEKIELNYCKDVANSIFVNEKVAFEDYNNGYISWSDYTKYINNSDVKFIKSEIDSLPYEKFLAQNFSIKRRLKRLIKQLLKLI